MSILTDRALDLEADMPIDESALDMEWLDQPNRFLAYAQAEADAKRAYDEAREALEYEKAQLDRMIRKDPNRYDLEKVTEAVVSAAVREHTEDRVKEVIEARYEWEMMSKAVAAMEMRKRALENLVKLLALGYFAAPTEPRDLAATKGRWNKELTERRKKRSDAKVASRMKRSKK
jgi:hypothetical protein